MTATLPPLKNLDGAIFSQTDLTVRRGKRKILLNQRTVERQGIDRATLVKIKASHLARFDVLDAMAATDNRQELRRLAAALRELDFTLQSLWGFPRDASRHRFWEVPKCTCPKLENADRWGKLDAVHDATCLIHGESTGIEIDTVAIEIHPPERQIR